MQPDYHISTFVGHDANEAQGTAHSVFVRNDLDAAPFLQRLSREMSETVVLMEVPPLPPVQSAPRVRFFSHGYPVLRCGSGTLAAGWVLSALGVNATCISTTDGALPILKDAEHYGYESLPLPQRPLSDTSLWGRLIQQTIRCGVLSGGNSDYLILELANEAALSAVRMDEPALRCASNRALILTARTLDGYVLRYFAPQYGPLEAGATGSANIQLLRYWYQRGERGRLNARQCSASGGAFWGVPGPGAVTLYGRVRLTGTG